MEMSAKEVFMKKVFVGNLDFGATEETIRSAFEQYGAVERVSLMTDRDTGRSRGFAFVEMSDAQEADQAIAGLNGTNLGGRAINVNEARPKTDNRARGGGERRERRW
jgi:cold-inducible RNA-binding protein